MGYIGSIRNVQYPLPGCVHISVFLGFGGLGLFRAEGSVIQGLGLGGLGFKVVIATSSRLENNCQL